MNQHVTGPNWTRYLNSIVALDQGVNKELFVNVTISKPICHDFSSKHLQINRLIEFEKLGEKGAFLVYSAISMPQIDGFGATEATMICIQVSRIGPAYKS